MIKPNIIVYIKITVIILLTKHSVRMPELYGVMNLSSLILNDTEQTLKINHKQVENTTEEETVLATASDVIHRMLWNIC